VAGELFFKKLRDKGTLLASVCPECGFTYLPARMFCERCMERIEEYVEAGVKGTLMSFTVSFEDFQGNPLDTPEYWGLINIHGTDTNLIHRLGGKDLDYLCVGDEVKAVLATKKKRTGNMNDILYFALA
jgi:uncharacterized OB-fold protein